MARLYKTENNPLYSSEAGLEHKVTEWLLIKGGKLWGFAQKGEATRTPTSLSLHHTVPCREINPL